ncbi:MAG: hypothetical protein ABDH61_06465 [Acidilobaceae archaeon]
MEFLREGVRVVRLEDCKERCGDLCKEGAVLLVTREELEEMRDLPRECLVLVIEEESP